MQAAIRRRSDESTQDRYLLTLKQGHESALQSLIGLIPERAGLAITRIRDNALARIHMDSRKLCLAQRGRDQKAGETFAKAKKVILRPSIKFPRALEFDQSRFELLNLVSQFALQRAAARSGDDFVGHILMANKDVTCERQRRSQFPVGRGSASLKQLIRDLRQSAHHDNRLQIHPAAYDCDQSLDCGGILD